MVKNISSFLTNICEWRQGVQNSKLRVKWIWIIKIHIWSQYEYIDKFKKRNK